jgi:hypothetical protein
MGAMTADDMALCVFRLTNPPRCYSYHRLDQCADEVLERQARCLRATLAHGSSVNGVREKQDGRDGARGLPPELGSLLQHERAQA